MKKILLILLAVTILGILGWIFLFPSKSAPVIDQVQDYLPFGNGEDLPLPENIDSGAFGEFSEEDHSATDSRSKLFQISKEPIAGAAIISSTSTVFIRYAERATGHIYDFNLYTLERSRVTNQTIPKVYEAIFSSDGNKVLYRMLSDDDQTRENVSLTLTPPKNTSTTTEIFHTITSTILRNDIEEVALGPNNTLYYVLKDDSSVVSSNFEGKNLKTLYSSPFNNWRIGVATAKIILWTKPSSNSDGYAYTLNPTNLSLTKIVSGLEGLLVNASPKGASIIYSFNDSGRTRTALSSIPLFESFEILPATLAEKCAWSTKNEELVFCGVPNGSLSSKEPEDWQKGISHYSDNIWSFDAEFEKSQMLGEPAKIVGVDIDIMNPQVLPNDDYLIFTNKKDLSLWAFRIE
jgi:hypothetical protein